MDEGRKRIWINLVTAFLGEECVAYIRAHPCEPDLEIESGAIVLNEVISEEEKFFYQLLPSESNGKKVLASSVDAISVLWELWWVFISIKHHLFGALGIRKGWVLVQPNTKNSFSALIEQLQKEQRQVVVGEFKFRNPEEKDFVN